MAPRIASLCIAYAASAGSRSAAAAASPRCDAPPAPPATADQLSEPAVTDRQGIGFGWLQNAWLLHARLKIHRG
eukprot:SAG25_NODE_6586_length_547_cov_1.569196_1_plen_73_part_10